MINEEQGYKIIYMSARMTVDGWVVELHGTMYTKLSRRMNRVTDDAHDDLFHNGNVRNWNNNGVQVSLLRANNDVIVIFNHIINHFFLEGVGLRQICDWCRLFWVYRQEMDVTLLEVRLKKMGLVTEWKTFYNLASRYLGMLDSGNFGHNRDVSYRAKESKAVVSTITLWRRICDFARFIRVFPVDAPKFFGQYLWNKMSCK